MSSASAAVKAFTNPTSFKQILVTSEKTVFRVKTTSPKSFLILTKDTQNHALWNPSMATNDDSAGQISKFRSRYTSRFPSTSTSQTASSTSSSPSDSTLISNEDRKTAFTKPKRVQLTEEEEMAELLGIAVGVAPKVLEKKVIIKKVVAAAVVKGKGAAAKAAAAKK